MAVAAELFRIKGYSATNVEEIAARAEVGVATIYKYFSAKGGLIRELWRPKIEIYRQRAEAVTAAPPADPGVAVAALMDAFEFSEKWQSRDLLRAVAGMDLGYAELFQGIRQELDALILDQLQLLLRRLEDSGALLPGLNHRDIAFIVYGIFNEHFQFFAVHEEVTVEVVREDLRRRLKLLFVNWTPATLKPATLKVMAGKKSSPKPRG
nr:TetR/AcrR family transcriptional regulator [Govania unica]